MTGSAEKKDAQEAQGSPGGIREDETMAGFRAINSWGDDKNQLLRYAGIKPGWCYAFLF